MATVQTIVDRGLRLIGQLPSGVSATSAETADGIITINAMLDSWRNDKLLCFAYQVEALTLANGTASYTVGTSGNLNTNRPVEILNAYIVASGISYEVLPMSETEYAAISQKTTTADWPSRFLFRPSIASSQATIIVWPVPNAARTLDLTTRVVVSAFAAAGDTITLPPGWEDALATNFAVRAAPEYEVQASADVKGMAKEALAGIKRSNISAQPRRMLTELGVMFSPGKANILTDGR